MVARKPSFIMQFLKILMIMLTVVFVLVGFIFLPGIPGLLLAALAAIGAYFAYLNASIEYEYLYVDKEISIDKVLAKSRRKKAASYSLEQMEIFAPLNSHRLDSYKNRQMKTIDYSSGIAAQPERRYMMIWNGDTKLILEPNAEMVSKLREIYPGRDFLKKRSLSARDCSVISSLPKLRSSQAKNRTKATPSLIMASDIRLISSGVLSAFMRSIGLGNSS